VPITPTVMSALVTSFEALRFTKILAAGTAVAMGTGAELRTRCTVLLGLVRRAVAEVAEVPSVERERLPASGTCW